MDAHEATTPSQCRPGMTLEEVIRGYASDLVVNAHERRPIAHQGRQERIAVRYILAVDDTSGTDVVVYGEGTTIGGITELTSAVGCTVSYSEGDHTVSLDLPKDDAARIYEALERSAEEAS